MNKGAHSYHEGLYQELIRYLQSQYLGKSEVLLDACSELLYQPGLLYSDPYIESSPSYATLENGIDQSDLPEYIKVFFEHLCSAGLGVYRAPFTHQIEALKCAWEGTDLLVSTGTGSGKTECFMWPLLAKLLHEAHENSSSWNGQRGMRALVMYPMNALVSDQISRLRRLLGDEQGTFISAFRLSAGTLVRRPQFGMYTGRTPYAGPVSTRANDKELATSLGKLVLRGPDDPYYCELVNNGKIPAKHDLQSFIANLRAGKHITDPEDAEMITRFEMQACCPDILITNYSMLEYMLLRPIEDGIWESTKSWLNENPDEKLLFIIDEAHMYRGASGGEVALLIRRLLYRLGIDRSRLQFILTTASLSNDQAAIKAFFSDLTATNDECVFHLLSGNLSQLSQKPSREIPIHALLDLDIVAMDTDEKRRLIELDKFREIIQPQLPSWKNLEEAAQWLYKHLLDYQQFSTLFSKCRGHAISIVELGNAIFPDESKDRQYAAMDAMLSIAPMAKDNSGNVLFPIRMHMLFRGFQGVFTCSNPLCPDHRTKNELTIGRAFLTDAEKECPSCHARVFEMYNDRRCGALFIRGFVEGCQGKQYLWTDPGVFFSSIYEIHLYIPTTNEKLPPRGNSKNPLKRCYLDVMSGFIIFDDSVAGENGYRELWYCEFRQNGRPDILTFYECPKCHQKFSSGRITAFSTRGNQAFFNVISKQFRQQPPASQKKADDPRFPNDGRKVLLFSDSRQRAASLARDMSEASDEMAVRQLFMLALKKMHDYEVQRSEQLSLNDFYGYFLLAAIDQGIDLFTGDDNETFCRHKKELAEDLAMCPPTRQHQYIRQYNASKAPNEMQEHLLRVFCTRYNTLLDAGLCYLAPIEAYIYTEIRKLRSKGAHVSTNELNEDEFCEVFFAILHVFLSDDAALGHKISDVRRERIRNPYSGYGHKDFSKMPHIIAEVLGISHDIDMQKLWMESFKRFCEQGDDPDTYYLDLEMLHPVFDMGHIWYRCQRCGAVVPSRLNEHCPICGNSAIEAVDSFLPEDFWRANALNAVKGGQVRVIDTEEHTAQLSYKDQRSEMWARTERYEMRFQDIINADERPVDILSSTTTMEVGIDIGALVAVGLRNVPPMRENYQQRAGRAGRRGTNMATIVTFAEGGPHDAYYFHDPKPMLEGDPRSPWIDVYSKKLIIRHLCLIAVNSYIRTKANNSIDVMSAIMFFDLHFMTFRSYLDSFSLTRQAEAILLPKQHIDLVQIFKPELLIKLEKLAVKIKNHPDAYGQGLETVKQKTMLDALYEEGIIPTYSFPKDVVSTYIERDDGSVEYQVERGLDIAISEYAPGRSVIVDKQTYVIGGIYRNVHGASGGNIIAPALPYYTDSNYRKELLACEDCKWFGFKEDVHNGQCPFCGGTKISEKPTMIRPWGFAPRDYRNDPVSAIDEQYTYAGTPLYSSLPNDELPCVPGTKYIKSAPRANQRIIMINEGPLVDGVRQGFMFCTQCGAIVPGNDPKALEKIKQPGRKRNRFCRHIADNVILGHDFITDMMVTEFTLPTNIIDTESADACRWLYSAATTLAEAFRLTAGRMLDVEYTDIVSGFRKRVGANCIYIDVYLYDSLSSGAGYSSKIASCITELLQQTQVFLNSCHCDKACNDCLKNYRNQTLQSFLDRHAALELLQWGIAGKLPNPPSADEQHFHFELLRRLLQEEGINLTYTPEGRALLSYNNRQCICIVHPAMQRVIAKDNSTIFLSREALIDAKPFAMREIRSRLLSI